MSKEHQVDHKRIERAVREILIAVGEDPDREGLLETHLALLVCTQKSSQGSEKILRFI